MGLQGEWGGSHLGIACIQPGRTAGTPGEACSPRVSQSQRGPPPSMPALGPQEGRLVPWTYIASGLATSQSGSCPDPGHRDTGTQL